MESAKRSPDSAARIGQAPSVRERAAMFAALALDRFGRIVDCSAEAETMFRSPRDELLGRHVSALIPRLGNDGVIRDGQLDPQIHFLCHCGAPFQARRQDGEHFVSALSVSHLRTDGRDVIRVMIREVDDVREGRNSWCLD
ncbi:MAG: PAS domain-containing protein [Gammaproteobacteria bacterium]|nr:PAS domain-containing protein [Gammaproteobacteria bacterium]MBI5615928.1 PAS domain-containing protein [Gammaproteobacteria bacterium]